MNGTLLTSLYVFAVLFFGVGGLIVVVKLLTGSRRGDARQEVSPHDPQIMDEWFEQPAHRKPTPIPPMFPQTAAEHFQAAHEAIEQNLPVPLPPARGGERETW